MLCSCNRDLLDIPTASDQQAEDMIKTMEPRTRSYEATTGNKRALIISGGGNCYSNHVRYWNDCAFIYSTLKNVYGLSDNNIVVAMSDGINNGYDRYNSYGLPESSPLDLDGDGICDIDHDATSNGVISAISDIQSNSNPGDEVIIFVTDHGNLNASGSTLTLWNNESMSASAFIGYLSTIPPTVTKHIVMGQCHSGGFISAAQDLKQTTLATACTATQLSSATANGLHDEFLYHWTAALAGQYPNGTTANADVNSDGVISAREAFNYAEAQDTIQTETPQFYEYRNLFGKIPLFYQYNFIEPYVSGPLNVNRGNSYTYHIVNCNPDINPAILLSDTDFSLISSTDSTIVVYVDYSGEPKNTSVSFGLTASGTNYLSFASSVDDVVIWQAGTYEDHMGAIQAEVMAPSRCLVSLMPRYFFPSSNFLWKTTSPNWTITHKLLPEAIFNFTGNPSDFPSTLDVSIDLINPFGGSMTLTKTIDLTE